MASLKADTTDSLGALEPLVSRILADGAACGSTLFPGWSSVASIRTAATVLTIPVSPHSPFSCFYLHCHIFRGGLR